MEYRANGVCGLTGARAADRRHTGGQKNTLSHSCKTIDFCSQLAGKREEKVSITKTEDGSARET